MNQKLRLLMMTLLCAVVSIAWGAVTTTYTFTDKAWKATNNGVDANWQNGKSGNSYQTGQGVQVTTGVTGANATSPKSFTNISKIVVTYCTNSSSGVGTIKLQVGSNTEKTFSVTKPSSGGTTLKEAQFNYSTPESGAVKLTVNCTTNSIYIYSIAITDADNTPSISVSPTTINAGFEGVTNGTLSYSSNNVTVGEIVYYDDAEGANESESQQISWFHPTISNGTVTYIIDENNSNERTLYFKVKGMVNGTTPEEFLNFVYSELVTVTQAAAPSALSIPWSEDFSGTDPLSKYYISDASIKNDKYAGGVAPELMISSKGYLTAKFDLNGYSGFLTLTFKSNRFENLQVTCKDKDNDANEIAISAIENGKYAINVPQGTNTLSLTVKNTKSNDNARVDDFNLVTGKPQVSANLSYSPESFTAYLGEENVFPVLSNEYNLPITYSSSNEEIATIDTNGNITLNAAGTTTITATSEETVDYYAGEASYTLTVIDPNAPGGKNNPYTVAQARDAIDAGTGTEGVYAKGIVSKIVTPYSSQYGNISYNISDDGTEGANQLQAFRGKSYNGYNFTSENDIKVGDEVVIYGNLIKYNNSIYEFAQDNQLVSLKRAPSITVTSSNVELAYNATAGEIEYRIEYPVEGKSLSATTEANWISNISVESDKVTFVTTANEGEARTATITLAYEGAESVTVTVTQEAFQITDVFELVTSTDNLAPGDQIIIVNAGNTKALSTTQNSNNRGATSVTESNGTISVTSSSDVQVITLQKNGVLWYFNTGNGYLYAASGSNNYLRTEPTADDNGNASATISINNGVASIVFKGTNTRNILKYNSQSSLFACYEATASQDNVKIYRKVAPATPFTLTISELATDGTSYYATMSSLGNGNFKVPAGVEVSVVYLNENKKIERNPSYEEGKVFSGDGAYLVEAQSAGTYVFEPTTEAVSYGISENWLYPTFANVKVIAPDENSYFFYQLSRNAALEDNSVGFYWGKNCANGVPFSFNSDHKAYLAVPKTMFPDIQSASAITFDDNTDGINGITTGERGERGVYTLTGVRVDSKNLPKGIYIVDGKKQVVK